jgi:hypothetical protein
MLDILLVDTNSNYHLDIPKINDGQFQKMETGRVLLKNTGLGLKLPTSIYMYI